MSEWLAAEELWSARWIFLRGLGVVYAIAFTVALNQFRPLLGEQGLLPTPAYLHRTDWRSAPSLLRLHYSDRFVGALSWVGILLSIAMTVGLADLGPLWLPMVGWLVLWVLYLSIVNVGQRFYSFGWESLLLEAGFLGAFLGHHDRAPSIVMMALLWWLLFRVEWGAGLIKIRGDQCWRDLTCLYYHHETQPMPNPLSRWFHHLPRPLHRVEVTANHVTQLVLPLLLIAPQPFRGGAAAAMVVTQGWLMASGNFAFLNALTLLLAVTAVRPGALDLLTPGPPADIGAMPVWFDGIVVVVAVAMVVLGWWPLRNMLSRAQAMNAGFNSLHLGNTYGAFGSITRTRREIVIEATLDDPTDPGADWREYEFRAKPGDPARRPPLVAPYHLRLDWLMWFVALSPAYGRGWFEPLLGRLLEADGPTLALLRRDPFDGTAPAAIRARLYEYRFTTRAEKRENGHWWARTDLGPFTDIVTLPPSAPREQQHR